MKSYRSVILLPRWEEVGRRGLLALTAAQRALSI
jgi:hypothetical protein